MSLIDRFRRLRPEHKMLCTLAVLAVLSVALHFMGIGGAGVIVFAAALSTGNPNLADAYKERAPNGGLLPVIKVLTQLYPFVEDATWTECNNGSSHDVLSENALPVPTYRGYNEGVAPSKDGTQKVAETSAMAASLSKIDVGIVDRMGPEYRARRIAAHMRGQVYDLESKCFYSSTKTSPKQFHGLFPRLDLTTATPAGNQILKVDASPSGSDQASIALVGWGPETVHMVYPQGSSAGVKHDDMGKQLVKDAGGTNEFRAYVDWIQIEAGLAVENHRYVARGCNIDTSALSSTGVNVIEALIRLIYKVDFQDKSVRWRYYVPRKLAEFLHLQARSGVTNSTLRIDNIEGAPVVMANGIPIRVSDGLTITEAVVS